MNMQWGVHAYMTCSLGMPYKTVGAGAFVAGWRSVRSACHLPLGGVRRAGSFGEGPDRMHSHERGRQRVEHRICRLADIFAVDSGRGWPGPTRISVPMCELR